MNNKNYYNTLQTGRFRHVNLIEMAVNIIQC